LIEEDRIVRNGEAENAVDIGGGVEAGVEIIAVGAAVALQRVVAVAAVKLVRSATADQPVVAVEPLEAVGAAAATAENEISFRNRARVNLVLCGL
jgi:hypothetical protein